jgi:predicted nucleic acid-binding protein
MALLIDTSLWIDFSRARSSSALKRLIAPFILDPEARLADPIIFEMLRNATPAETKQLGQQFSTLVVLASPPQLWIEAANLGQACKRTSFTVGSLDLLIATIALHHGAEIVTFDSDYQRIASVSSLQVKLLQRPTP